MSAQPFSLLLGGRLPEEPVSVSPDSELLEPASEPQMPGATQHDRKRRGLSISAPENLQYCSQTPEGAKDYALRRKKPANLSH